jgi:hypothetical protein
MHTKHHHHIGAIAFFPLVLVLFAPHYGQIAMAGDVIRAEELLGRSEQELQLTDTRYKEMQTAYHLIAKGEEKTVFPSSYYLHTQKKFSSNTDRYMDSKHRISALNQRLEIFEDQFNDLGEKIVHLDLSKQEATLIENGKIITKYPVSSGAYETPTPRGEFQIHSKQKLRVSSQAVAYRMPYYMAFTKSGSHGLHALPYLGDEASDSDFWHEARSHIGIPVSHGCVRFLTEDIVDIYEWADVGTSVYINS